MEDSVEPTPAPVPAANSQRGRKRRSRANPDRGRKKKWYTSRSNHVSERDASEKHDDPTPILPVPLPEEDKDESAKEPLPDPESPPMARETTAFEEELARIQAISRQPPPGAPLFRPRSMMEQYTRRQFTRRDFPQSPPFLHGLSFTDPLFVRGPRDQSRDKFKKLFDGLVSGDSSRMLQSAIELASELAMSQESSVSPSTLEMFVDPLIACLRSPPVPDIIAHAATCLTNMIDMMPQVGYAIASRHGVEALCERLQDVGSIDVMENVINAVEKLSEEVPHAVVTGKGLERLARVFEFFEFSQQKKILKILLLVSKRLESQHDIEEYALPAAEPLGLLLRSPGADADGKEKLEGVSTVYHNLCAIVNRLYESNPAVLSVVRKYYEKLAPPEIVVGILGALTAGLGNFTSISPTTWQNLMMALKHVCQLSPAACCQCVSGGLLGVIQRVLTDSSSSEGAAGMEKAREAAIQLLDAILPQKCFTSGTKKQRELNKERAAIETEKEIIVHNQANLVQVLGEGVLSRLITIFEEGSSMGIRFACMQTIEKLFGLCDPQLISKTVTPQTAAHIMNANLTFADSLFVCLGLRFLEAVLEKLAPQQPLYVSQTKREGVFERVKQLLDLSYILKTYEEDRVRPWLHSENPYVKFMMGEAQAMHKRWTAQQRRSKASAEAEEEELPRSRGTMMRPDIEGFARGRWSPVYLSRNLNYFIYIKSSQLCEKYLMNEEYLKQCPSLSAAETCLASCYKLSSDLAATLAKRSTSTAEDWRDCFVRLADIVVSDISVTNYEATDSHVIQRVYQSLCVPPSKYTVAGREEDAKRESSDPTAEDLRQLALRHDVFVETFLTARNNSTGFLGSTLW